MGWLHFATLGSIFVLFMPYKVAKAGQESSFTIFVYTTGTFWFQENLNLAWRLLVLRFSHIAPPHKPDYCNNDDRDYLQVSREGCPVEHGAGQQSHPFLCTTHNTLLATFSKDRCLHSE